MKKLTDRQREVLEFIIEFKTYQGFAPSYEQIGKHLGITKGSVASHMSALQHKGHIEKPKGKCRAIRVLRYVVIANRNIRVGIPGTSIVKVK